MPPESRGRHQRRILIIEDDPASRAALDTALARDYSLTVVPDPAAAPRLLPSLKPDLVILALGIWRASALACLTDFRTMTDVPVLVTSTRGTKALVVAAWRAGANDYLDKPFSGPELLERVRSLLAQGPRPTHLADRVRRFIQHHYMEDWTVARLATALQVSVRTLRGVLRRVSHHSVMEYLRDVRMAHACDLLTMTDLPIRTVAHRVGFREANYFARVFRHRAGCTPQAYRTAQRQAAAAPRAPRR